MSDMIVIQGISGPGAGRIATLAPGQRLVVGRDPACDVAIPDSEMSRRHLELAWDAEGVVVRDAGSSNGTFADGRRVADSAVAHHEIRAGASVFRVERSALCDAPASSAVVHGAPALCDAPTSRMAAPPPEGPAFATRRREITGEPASPAMAGADASRTVETDADAGAAPPRDSPAASTGPRAILLEVERTELAAMPVVRAAQDATAHSILAAARGEPLYAVIDAARSLHLAVYARRLGYAVYTLFAGDQAADVAMFGPCLVPLEAPERFLDVWLRAAGESAGVLLASAAPLLPLHAHLRDAFVVKDATGQEYFLRYYDPRVLPKLAASFSDEQAAAFFGPVSAWILEVDEGRSYGCLRRRTGPSDAAPIESTPLGMA
jgi:hypothetical protein